MPDCHFQRIVDFNVAIVGNEELIAVASNNGLIRYDRFIYLPHSLTHSLAHSLTHSLTHSLAHCHLSSLYSDLILIRLYASTDAGLSFVLTRQWKPFQDVRFHFIVIISYISATLSNNPYIMIFVHWFHTIVCMIYHQVIMPLRFNQLNSILAHRYFVEVSVHELTCTADIPIWCIATHRCTQQQVCWDVSCFIYKSDNLRGVYSCLRIVT